MKTYLVWLWHNTRGIRLNTVVRIAVGIANVATGLAIVWLSKRFIDETIRTGDGHAIVQMIVYLVAVMLADILLSQLFRYLAVTADIRQVNDLRRRLFGILLRRRLYGQAQMHSGDVTSRMERDVQLVSDTTTSLIPSATITLVQLVGAFWLLQSMDARLAWALLLFTPLLVGLSKYMAQRLRPMTHDIRQQESRVQALVQESVELTSVLSTLGSGPWLQTRLDGLQDGLRLKVRRRARFTVATRTLLSASFGLGWLAAFVYGGLQLRDGLITFGVLTSFLQLVGQIQQPILSLMGLVPQVINTSASIDRLLDIERLDTADGLADRDAAWPAGPTTPPEVALRSVSYAYDGRSNVLTDFSHVFRSGSHVAIVGTTGAGKTTLFRLLLGLVEPTQGAITLAGRAADAEGRRVFVYVPQGNSLMSGSIRFNLQLANPDATEAEMLQALHTAAADFVADLPDGLDTECSERGGRLSEGQAQRIAIARGLLRRGSVLLLDEISASLDEATEALLFERLFAACPDQTILLISHRPAVTALCDDVVRL